MKKTKFLGLFLIVSAFLWQGCATIYVAPDMPATEGRHRLIAILPFETTIQYNKLPKDVTPEQVEQNEDELDFVFQSQLYNRFLKKRAQFFIDFQDIDHTNMVLKRNKIDIKKLGEYSKDELARLLDVDAVVSGQVVTTKPMSTGAALAVGILFDIWGTTNTADVTVSLHDGKDSKLLWRFNHVYSGTVGSSPEQLANEMMQVISRKFPYRITK